MLAAKPTETRRPRQGQQSRPRPDHEEEEPSRWIPRRLPRLRAPRPAPPGSLGFPSDVTPTSGVLHVNTRHISGFTVIGNHLAQHCDLSLIAIALAAHIQSLPAGAKVGIKVLVERFPYTHPQPERICMVSSPHEAMHRIFQEYPGLFSRVSEVLGIDIPPPTSVTILPTDLTEARPVERRVDTLLRIETRDDGPFLLAIESQGKKDPRKTTSWPYYVTYLHNRYGGLPVLLLVVCQDHATAEWAARPLTIGLRQWQTLTLNPLVAGPHNMPVITNVADARKDLALATLAAITHADNPDVGAILKTLSAALREAPEDIADPIVELTAQGLGNRPAAQQWRNLVAVDTSFYKSFMSEEIRDEGRAEGRDKGLAEGRAEGRAASLLVVLEARGIAVTDKIREKITNCSDPQLLNQWLQRATTASSAEEVFAEA